MPARATAPGGDVGEGLDRHDVRRHGWIAVQGLCLLGFVGYRIGAAATTTPAVWQDSEAYKALARYGYLSPHLWTGSRAPLVPLLMKVTSSYDAYVVFQGVFGGLAWAFLAFTVSRLVDGPWRRVLAMLAVLGLGASPLVMMWDGSALSESPALSTLALLCACAIWIVRRFTWPRLAALAVAAFVYCGLRDADIWLVALVGPVLLGVGVARLLTGLAVDPDGARARLSRNWPRARAVVATGAVLLAVGLATGGAAAASHRNLVNVEEAFAVRIFPYPDRVAWFAGHGMPQAAAVDALAAQTQPARGEAPVVGVDFQSPQWAPLRTWFQHDGLSTYGLYLVLHPDYVLGAPFASPRLTFNDAHGDLAGYSPTGYPLAGWVERVFVPNRFVELALAGLALTVAGARGLGRSTTWRFAALFGAVGLGSMLLAWHGEGMEVTRHMVEGNVQVRLGVLLALVLAVLASSPATEEALADEPVTAPAAGADAAAPPAPAVSDPAPVPLWSTQAPLDSLTGGEALLSLGQRVGVVAEADEGPAEPERL